MFSDGDAALAEFGQSEVQRMLCALEHGGKRDVERQPLRFQPAPGFLGFGNTLLGQVRVFPAGEEIFQVPFALAMSHQHEKTFAHVLCPSNLKGRAPRLQESVSPSTSAIE